MTSMDDGDLARAGYGMGVQDLIARRAKQIYEAGCPGIVCSATDWRPCAARWVRA